MLDSTAGFLGRLGGADIHSAIDLHRVDADNLGVQALCEVECQRAFARSCNAKNKNHLMCTRLKFPARWRKRLSNDDTKPHPPEFITLKGTSLPFTICCAGRTI